jgi:hypothetical protein
LLGQEFAMRVDAGEQSRRRKIIGKPPLGRKVIVCTGITA